MIVAIRDRCSRLLLASCAVLACDDKKEEATAEGNKSAPADKVEATEPAVARLQGAVEIPGAVPSEAVGVLVVRVPKSLYASFIAADPFGLAKEGMDGLKEELDEFLGRTLGARILDATSVAAFLVGQQDFGVVLVGVKGELQGKKVGAHEGVDLFAAGDASLQLARVDDLLLMGTPEAMKAAIAASKDPAKSAKSGVLAKLLEEHSEGAAVALAVDLDRAPPALRKEIPPAFAVDRGLVTFGADGLLLRAEGEKAQVDALANAITAGITLAAETAETQRRRATEGSDPDILEGAASIMAAHYARSAKTLLVPKVDGDALTISVPVKAGDPAILAAVAGMSAAIAIPALTKYTRRAKTSEARVNLAKMFDAASAYFNEEHVERGTTTLGTEADPFGAMPAAHRCPNDGKASGQSGITPPLSVDCSHGPAGRCVPSVGASSLPGAYDMKLWTDNPVWNGLNFQLEGAHAFHYNFIWANGGTGFGTCQFTAQAFGDLDGDGVFSTYERAGAADENGVNAAAGLYIDQDVE